MHLPSKTISTSVILATLLPLTAAISPSTAQCIRSSSRHEAAVSPCGDKAVLDNCLASLADFFLQTDIELCYLNAGCGPDEAAASAIQLLTRCASDEDPESSTFVQELRKRQRRPNATPTDEPTDNTDTVTDETPTADQTDTKDTTPTRNSPVRTSAAKTTEAATTEDANTDVETVVVTNPSKPTAALSETTSGPLPADFCTTSTTVTINSCSSTSDGGKTECARVPVAKPTCRQGYLCKMDSSGVTTCMEKQDKLTTGGIIVALAFSAAIVVSVALMTFFCCREKSQQKKLKAKMEAAAIAKASGVGKRNVSDRVPLMAAEGGPQDPSYGGQQYADAQPGPGQPNPFQDPARY